MEARIGRVFTRVAGLALVVVGILHAFACIFHFVAVLNTETTTWIEASGIVDASSTMDRCEPCLLVSYMQVHSTVFPQTSTCMQVCYIHVLGDEHHGNGRVW